MQLHEQVARISEKLQGTLSKLTQDGATISPAPEGSSLNAQGAGSAVQRGKIDKMSAEVVDSNPYSRLMALQRMGVVKDYERIRDKTVRSIHASYK